MRYQNWGLIFSSRFLTLKWRSRPEWNRDRPLRRRVSIELSKLTMPFRVAPHSICDGSSRGLGLPRSCAGNSCRVPRRTTSCSGVHKWSTLGTVAFSRHFSYFRMPVRMTQESSRSSAWRNGARIVHNVRRFTIMIAHVSPLRKDSTVAGVAKRGNATPRRFTRRPPSTHRDFDSGLPIRSGPAVLWSSAHRRRSRTGAFFPSLLVSHPRRIRNIYATPSLIRRHLRSGQIICDPSKSYN